MSSSSAPQPQPQPQPDEPADVFTEEYCLSWLLAYMPERDRSSGLLTDQRLRSHIKLALAARQQHPWAAAVPAQLWLNDVLAYRSVDEALDAQDWRPMFYDKFIPMVAGAKSLTEAAQILNRCVCVLGGNAPACLRVFVSGRSVWLLVCFLAHNFLHYQPCMLLWTML